METENNTEIEFEREREQEIKRERDMEYLGSYGEDNYSEWLSDNIKDMRGYFVEDNITEFNVLLEQNIIDETYDIDYWKESFCEENEQEFNDFCKQEFNNFCDLQQTENSLFNNRY